MSHAETVYASAVLVGEKGVLIRGPSGSGKSALVLALLAADPAENRLVADDRVELSAVSGRLLAAAPSVIAGLLEIRGQGIFRRPRVSPVRIDLVVDLRPLDECPRLPAGDDEKTTVEGIALPRLVLPAGIADAGARIAVALGRSAPAEGRNP